MQGADNDTPNSTTTSMTPTPTAHTADTNILYGFCFRPEPGRDDCSGPLRLWVGRSGEIRFIPTRYDIRHDEWDAVEGRIVPSGVEQRRGLFRRSPGQSSNRSSSHSSGQRLARYAAGMERDIKLVEGIVSEFEESRRVFTVDDIVEAFCTRTMTLPFNQLGV